MMDGRTPDEMNKKEEHVHELSTNTNTDTDLQLTLPNSSQWVKIIQNMNPTVKLTKITQQTLAQQGRDPAQLRKLLEVSARTQSRIPTTTKIKTPSKSQGGAPASAKTPVSSPAPMVMSPKNSPCKLRSNRKKKSSGASVTAKAAATKKHKLKPGSCLLWSTSQCSDAEKDSSSKDGDGGKETDSRPGTSSHCVSQQTTPAPNINTSRKTPQLSSIEDAEKDSSTETIPFISEDFLQQEGASPELAHPVDHCNVSVCSTSLLKSPQSSSRDSRGRKR